MEDIYTYLTGDKKDKFRKMEGTDDKKDKLGRWVRWKIFTRKKMLKKISW